MFCMVHLTLEKVVQVGNKVVKNCYNIFDKSPARHADYLAASNLQEMYEGWDIQFIYSHLNSMPIVG